MTHFWTVTQNNSGGRLDHDPDKGIGSGLCVEAHSGGQAELRMRDIIASYSASPDCVCCGRRWDFYYMGAASVAPKANDTELARCRGIPAYVHYLDGRIEALASDRVTA